MKSLVIVLAMIVTLSSHALASYCCVDGSCVYLANLTTGQTPLTSLCGHSVGGSGCNVTMGQSETISSGDCVTLRGATLKMNSKSISCTGQCGRAIWIDNYYANNNDVIGDGTITGAWTTGVGALGVPNSFTIQDVVVSLDPTWAGTGVGLLKTVTRVVVTGAWTGINAYASASDIVDSIVTGCTTGLSLSHYPSSSGGPNVTGTLATDNATNVRTVGGTIAKFSLRDSTIRDATGCDFEDTTVTGCQSASAVFTLSGVNFIDNTIIH